MKKNLLCTVLAFSAVMTLAAGNIEIRAEKSDCVVKQGEDVLFHFKSDDPKTEKIHFIVSADGRAQEKVTLPLKDGQGSYLVRGLDQPGWLLVTAADEKWRTSSRSPRAGVLAAPFEIRQGGKRPADFDAFWDAELKKAKEMPLEVKLTPVELDENQSRNGTLKAWEFSISAPGPRPASGFLAMPADAKEKSLPIYIMFHGASAIDASAPPLHYADVAICFVVNKFGIPNRLYKTRAEWMKSEYAADIAGFARRNTDDRDECFFKWMILRNYRVQMYAKTLPEWNGKVMILNGESLGGAQSLIGASLDPDVTFVCACVPALCDHNGAFAHRRNGWPGMWRPNAEGTFANEKDRKISEVAEYFDVVNFIQRLTPKTEVSIGTGTIDITCPPSGVLAAYNTIPEGVVKNIVIRPDAGHNAGNRHGGIRIGEILGHE